MTREQVREALPFLQAYADGKAIQYRCDGKYSDIKTILLGELEINSARYRIKPEPKYRPFANADECWQEMQKHQPFGWVKTCDGYSVIDEISNDVVSVAGLDNYEYDEAMGTYTFADGTPFGIKEGTDD